MGVDDPNADDTEAADDTVDTSSEANAGPGPDVVRERLRLSHVAGK
jgi:hypothetical protein